MCWEGSNFFSSFFRNLECQIFPPTILCIFFTCIYIAMSLYGYLFIVIFSLNCICFDVYKEVNGNVFTCCTCRSRNIRNGEEEGGGGDIDIFCQELIFNKLCTV